MRLSRATAVVVGRCVHPLLFCWPALSHSQPSHMHLRINSTYRHYSAACWRSEPPHQRSVWHRPLAITICSYRLTASASNDAHAAEAAAADVLCCIGSGVDPVAWIRASSQTCSQTGFLCYLATSSGACCGRMTSGWRLQSKPWRR